MFPRWEKLRITINEAHFNIRHAGLTGKPALVLVHGFSDSGLCWQREAEASHDEFEI
jgi:pimeloyl-ACP methyl ester carboxylesterase